MIFLGVLLFDWTFDGGKELISISLATSWSRIRTPVPDVHDGEKSMRSDFSEEQFKDGGLGGEVRDGVKGG